MTCESLATKAELAALRSEIMGALGIKIDKPERPQIIEVSTRTAVSEILPSLEEVKQRLGVLGAIALTALDIAKEARDNVQEFIRALPEIRQMAVDAWNEALSAGGKASEALIKASEASLQSLKAYDKAASAEKRAILAEQMVYEAFRKMDQIRAKADLALAQSNEATKKANIATELAKEGILRANHAFVQANDAMRQANLAETKAVYAFSQANEAMRQANVAYDRATEAYRLGQANQSDIIILKQDNAALKQGLEGLKALRNRDLIRTIEQSERQSRQQDIDRLQTRQTIGGLEQQLNGYENLFNYQNATVNNLSGQVQQSRQLAGGGGLTAQQKREIKTIQNTQNTFKNDLSTFKNDLSTFKNDLSTFKVNDGLFKNDLSTFKNDLSTFRNDLSTFRNDLNTFNWTNTQEHSQQNNRITNLENFTNSQTTTTNNRLTNLENAATTLNNADILFDSQLRSFGFIANNLANNQVFTNNRVGVLENKVTNLTNTQTQQQQQINELDVNSTQKLTNIETAIGGIGLAVGGIVLQTNRIATQTAPAALATAAETGVCNSTKPGGCMQNALNPIKKGVDDALKAVGPAGALALQNAQTLNNTISILSLLQTVYAYLQNFFNFTKGKFEKLWDFLGMDRLLNVLNFAIGLHNAAMLSKNLVGTLIETTNNVLTAVGVRNPEGEAVNIGPIIGSTIDSWMANLLGTQVWSNTKTVWNRANRILTAAARLKDATYAFGNSVAEMGETLGENISQLSNAMIDEGLISFDTLDYKDPKPKFRQHLGKTQNFLTGLNESAEAINEFASQIIETTELATEMDKAFDELKTELANGGKQKKDTEKTNQTNSSTTATITRSDTKEGDYGS